MTGMLRALPAGSEARVRHFLTAQRGYGLAADATIAAAREAPGRYAYTPDGCVWVAYRDGQWAAGDSSRAEARLADARRGGPLATRVDPDAVHGNDAVTYTALSGTRELTGRVEWATRDAVHVIRIQYGYAVGYAVAWERITAHVPRTGLGSGYTEPAT
jgi:hypothetical protein